MEEGTEIGDGDPREEIARLEARIEELADKIESCRKFVIASRASIGFGGLFLLLGLIGAIRLDALVLTGSTVATLGGIVLLGSNRSTANEAAAQLEATEARRASLIGQIDLRVVSNRDGINVPQ